jgi:CRISPR-associated protein Cas1
MLNTLHVLSPDLYATLDGENVVLRRDGDEVRRVPLHNLEGVVMFGHAGASPALMGACAKRGIQITLLTMNGHFLARVCGEISGNVLLRKTQYRLSDNAEQSLALAKMFLTGKIYNQRNTIERALRDHALRLDVEKMSRVSEFLKGAVAAVGQTVTPDELRGVEGEAASLYFSVFDDMILQQKAEFSFNGRSRRPGTDCVNALMNFAYTLLAHECSAALSSVGLDPYVGFLHRDRPGRISLALDMMEELRSMFADRFVLTLINNRQITGDGFETKENGAVLMDKETKSEVLNAWQNRKKERRAYTSISRRKNKMGSCTICTSIITCEVFTR